MELFKRKSLPKPKTYGIDLDGVCFDFLGGFARWLDANYGLKIRAENLSNYYWTDIPEEHKEKIWSVYFHEFCKGGGLLDLEVLPGAKAGLRHLIQMGNNVHFITSREPYTKDDTLKVIKDKLEIRNPSVHIAKHGGKSEYVKALSVDTFIDDAPHTIAEVAANTRAQVYCMDQPYNKNVDTTFIRRVHNWQEFLEAEGWMKKNV